MDAKRGFEPGDEKKFSSSSVEKMRTASRHIFYLINEGYDIKSASTFVGNHYAFSERQRLALVRSISTQEQLEKRKSKLKISGDEVWIDGFNTIISLEVLLNYAPLFEGMDGTVRDLASLRGTYRIIPETRKAVQILFDELKILGVSKVNILLDEPISNSGRLKSLIAEVYEAWNSENLSEKSSNPGNSHFSLDIQLLRDVDRTLWEKENVITTDAIILDHCISWLNLMRGIVEKRNLKTIRVFEN